MFYDIGRGEWKDHQRNIDKYINDFIAFYSSIEVDLNLFSSKEIISLLKEKINKTQNFLSTVNFIEFNIDNFYFIKNIDKINNVQSGSFIKNYIRPHSSTAPEYTNAKYVALMWSKAEVLKFAKEFNLISEKCAWIDFGIAHCSSNFDYVNNIKNKVLVEKNHEKSIFFKRQNVDLSLNPWDYRLLSDDVVTPGGFYILKKDHIDIFWNFFKYHGNMFLDMQITDDDQTILSIFCKNNEKIIDVKNSWIYKNNPKEGDWFPIFDYLENKV